LAEVVPGVLVRTSPRYATNTTVIVLDEPSGAAVVVDPAVDPDELSELAAELTSRDGRRVVAGWSTHPHWDHVLWSSALGRDVPRYGCAANALHWDGRPASDLRHLEDSSPGHELDLCGRLLPVELTADGAVAWPGGLRGGSPRCVLVEHAAHAIGHGALFLPDRGVLVAGDMVSDVEIPLLDLGAADPVTSYRAGLARYAELVRARAISTVIPGHGSVGDGPELERRIQADISYLDDLEAGRSIEDARLGPQWLRDAHDAHVGHLR
jgi:glyoxylase-like metal-dependent hydrolase (beta-lactamase superfamily II)